MVLRASYVRASQGDIWSAEHSIYIRLINRADHIILILWTYFLSCAHLDHPQNSSKCSQNSKPIACNEPCLFQPETVQKKCPSSTHWNRTSLLNSICSCLLWKSVKLWGKKLSLVCPHCKLTKVFPCSCLSPRCESNENLCFLLFCQSQMWPAIEDFLLDVKAIKDTSIISFPRNYCFTFTIFPLPIIVNCHYMFHGYMIAQSKEV